MRISASLLFAILSQSITFAQNNAVYPQGNVIWAYTHINYTFYPVFYGGDYSFWTASNFPSNGEIYTTEIPNGFLRYDDLTDETFFLSNYNNQEYNITLPASQNIGDTINITNLVLCLNNENFRQVDNFFDTQELYENPDLQILAIVVDSLVGYGVTKYIVSYLLYDSDTLLSNLGGGNLTTDYVPGIGRSVFQMFSGVHIYLSCVFVDNDAFDTFNPTCVLSTPKFIDNTLGLYPNPNNGVFKIISNESFAGPVEINIYNAQGAVVFSNKTQHLDELIDCSFLSAGVYFVKLSGAWGNNYSRIIKN